MATTAVPGVLTMGVEEEFFIIDPTTDELATRSDALVSVASVQLGESVTRELNRCQIETASEICESSGELTGELRRLRGGLRDAATALELAVAAVATHPFSSWEDQEVAADESRYDRMERRYQVLARQQIICGCHVHVGVPDEEQRVEVMNRSRPWLAPLLALSANSPYWHGVDTGFDSYRTEVWQRWPTSGMPPRFDSRSDYDDLVQELRATGAVDDASNLYWYVRPSARWPTVEFRICDVCVEPDDAVALAALIRALVWTCLRETRRGDTEPKRSHYALDAAMWRAARYGLDGQLLDAQEPELRPAREVIEQLLDHVDEGLRIHEDSHLVRDQVETILTRGNGAAAQRQWLADSGGDRRVVMRELVDRTAPATLSR